MKKLLLSITSLLLLLTTTSCGPSKTGTLEVERTVKGSLYELTYQDLKTKVNSSFNGVIFINLKTCPACEKVKQDFLFDFVEQEKIRVYSYTLHQDKDEYKILTSLVDENSSNLSTCYDENNQPFTCFGGVPYMLFIEKGKAIKEAIGTKDINKDLFYKTLKLDEQKSYKHYDNDVFKLEFSQNPDFVKMPQDLERGVIYHTRSLENNLEVKYYLRPFMEDYNTNIYLDLNPQLDESYLEVMTSTSSHTEKERKHYISFLDTFTRW